MVILMMVLTMVGCSTLDCPLNNTTYTKYKLMGNVKTLQRHHDHLDHQDRRDQTAYSSIRM